MSKKYGIMMFPDDPHDPAQCLDAPYDSAEAAREAFELSMLDDYGAGGWAGATIVEVRECTSHNEIDWEPCGGVETLTTATAEDVREAARTDWHWLLDAVECVEAWRETDPHDVDVQELGDDSAVTTLIREENARPIADQIWDVARDEWERIQEAA